MARLCPVFKTRTACCGTRPQKRSRWVELPRPLFPPLQRFARLERIKTFAPREFMKNAPSLIGPIAKRASGGHSTNVAPS